MKLVIAVAFELAQFPFGVVRKLRETDRALALAISLRVVIPHFEIEFHGKQINEQVLEVLSILVSIIGIRVTLPCAKA